MKLRTPKAVPWMLFLVFSLAATALLADEVWIREGLNIKIMDVSIPADRKPVVTFQLTDNQNQPLDKDGNLTPGAVAPRFLLAYIPKGATQYVDYTVRNSTSTDGKTTVVQATTDSTGTFTPVGIGTGIYTYRFNTTLPTNYDASVTHTLAIQATRNLTSFGLKSYVANELKTWVPNGGPLTTTRDIVPTAACNNCHDPISVHGSRRKVEYCILCHTPQTTDANSGNTADMKVMIHKIHRGSSLPSVVAGGNYYFGNATTGSFSDVAFPMDIRNCTACHQGTTQVLNYLLNPSKDTCGSCHDDVNFQTGQNHPAGPSDDSKCAVCHIADGQGEYDAAVKDAHIPEYKSSQLLNPKLQVLSITNTAPGQKPTVTFKITDKDSNVMDPNKMGRLSLTLAGPTSDYQMYVTENPLGKVTVSNGVGSYTFAAAIPSDAKGTYVIEAEAYVSTVVTKTVLPSVTVRDAIDNVVTPFAVTGTLTQRRKVVSTANCVKCHDKLQLHGSNRNQVEACVVCHNPTKTDSGQRPAAAAPNEAIALSVLVHKIHTGEELSNEYTVYGNGQSKHNYNEVLYPGDRSDCLQCHLAGTYTLPIPNPSTQVQTPRNYWPVTMATTAACLGCHDSLDAAAHALINTTIIQGNQAESCSVCHKESADFSVSASHGR